MSEDIITDAVSENEEETKELKPVRISPTTETKNLVEIMDKTGNLYKSLAIISKRSRQINSSVKEELISKLNEFASTTDNLEEVFENREQIEISKFYEKMPNPSLLALNEFMDDRTYYRMKEQEAKEINLDDVEIEDEVATIAPAPDAPAEAAKAEDATAAEDAKATEEMAAKKD